VTAEESLRDRSTHSEYQHFEAAQEAIHIRSPIALDLDLCKRANGPDRHFVRLWAPIAALFVYQRPEEIRERERRRERERERLDREAKCSAGALAAISIYGCETLAPEIGLPSTKR
jgi:hypothetical protein